jgi:hypothetical protein
MCPRPQRETTDREPSGPRGAARGHAVGDDGLRSDRHGADSVPGTGHLVALTRWADVLADVPDPGRSGDPWWPDHCRG